MEMKLMVLDCVLVPLGLVLMAAYHIWLFRRIKHRPTSTVIGLNAINRRFWVSAMMEDSSRNGILAVQTFRNNIMASTVLASTAIMLCSLIAVLMANTTTGDSGGQRSITGNLVLGDTTELGYSIKFFSIIVCFVTAFLLNVQSIRYYSHASVLINVPCKRMCYDRDCVTAEYVGGIVNKGSYFWSLGLRAFYISFPLFLWIFGPIPMFSCCLVLLFLLYFLDVVFDDGSSRSSGYGSAEEGQELRGIVACGDV